MCVYYLDTISSLHRFTDVKERVASYQGGEASGEIKVNIFPLIALAGVGIAKGVAAIAAKAAIGKGVAALAAKVSIFPHFFLFISC